MSEFHESVTRKNLRRAFIEEAITCTKYQIFSMLAKQAGYDDISRFFLEAADNEKEHAKIWMKWYWDGKYPDIKHIMSDSMSIENQEGATVYPEFAQTAADEGFEHIAELFNLISKIEQEHEKTFKKLALTISDDVTPNPDGTYDWECSVCGCALRQTEKPDYCPVCANEKVFFFKRPR